MGREADVGTESFGALLRRYRGSRGLTQEELAERAGLHAQEISRLERDVVRNPRSTTAAFLAGALKLDEREKEAFVAATRRGPASSAGSPVEDSESAQRPPAGLADAEHLLASMATDSLPARGQLPVGSRMPLAPNPLFVGRSDELLQVARALLGGDTTVALGQVVACTGLGGLGKTQLAVEFVHRYGRFFAGGVFWLSFVSADEIPHQLAACAGPGAMDLAPAIENASVEERAQRVQRAWQSGVPRLLVFDNCEDEALLDAWRPPSGGCRVLVTSRRAQWSPTLGVTALPLDVLPRADSIELLRRYLPDLAPGDLGLDAIGAEVGDLPLALHLAGSYLRAYRANVSLGDYLVEMRRSDVVQHASLLGAGLDDSPSPTRHLQSVAQTFALCLGRLEHERKVDRVAIALLARIAYMAPGEPVPSDLLAKTLGEVAPLARADGLRRLGAVGLLEEGDGWVRLHRLLAQFVREERLDPTAEPAVGHALLDCGREAGEGHLDGAALAAVIPHLVNAVSAPSCDESRLADLCSATGLVLYNAGDLLALLHRTRGDLPTATIVAERALAISEQALGHEHPRTIRALNSLALVLLTQGDLAAARPLFERVVAINELTLGPDHAHTAAAVNNLALVLRGQGELAAARQLFERALSIADRALGCHHLNTAFALNNLARLLQAQCDPAAARPLFERALAIRERVLGPDHPDTVATRRALADLAAEGNGPAAGG